MLIKDDNNDGVFFSIITPNYNSGDKLLRAIKSLKNNSISFEHVIIDDCSTDDSFSSIEKLRNDSFNSNLILIRNSSNIGPGASRNKGLDSARGKYIIFLDADDYFLDNALDNFYTVIKSKNKIDVLLFKYHMITQTNRRLDFSNDSNNIELVADPIRDYLLDRIISSPWCKCINSNLAKKFRFPDIKVSEDAIYNLDIFVNAKAVFKINSTFYVFDKTEINSLTRRFFDRKEFIKFHEGWVFFEKKAFLDLNLNNSEELIANRKIRFEALYYINRMAISPNDKIDRFIVKSIRETIFKNIMLAKSELNTKLKLLCFMFYFFPSLTVKLLRFYNIS